MRRKHTPIDTTASAFVFIFGTPTEDTEEDIADGRFNIGTRDNVKLFITYSATVSGNGTQRARIYTSTDDGSSWVLAFSTESDAAGILEVNLGNNIDTTKVQIKAYAYANASTANVNMSISDWYMTTGKLIKIIH